MSRCGTTINHKAIKKIIIGELTTTHPLSRSKPPMQIELQDVLDLTCRHTNGCQGDDVALLRIPDLAYVQIPHVYAKQER